MDSEGAEQVYPSKAAARQALDRLPLLPAQRQPLRRAILRVTRSETIALVVEGSTVIVRVYRPGFDGYQVFDHVVEADGHKSIIQRAYNSEGTLVHYDVKKE